MGLTSTPSDNCPVLAGVTHRALEVLGVLVYEYDELGVSERVIPAGTIFQPWVPLPHLRGQRVPITLGEGALQFGWGEVEPLGRFLRWDDFFQRCAPNAARDAKAVRRLYEQPLVSPFAELPAIGQRLRLAASASGKVAEVDCRLAKLQTIQKAYADAAELQRGYDGFDNRQGAASCEATKVQLLAEAKKILAATKALCC